MSTSELATFIAAVAVLAMVPGPATALVVRRSALRGTKAAVPVIAGIELGIYVWAVAAAVGVAALVTASELAYTGLKIVGASVLVVLGIQAWRSARSTHGDVARESGPGPRWWHAAGTGALTNLANPKAAVFAFAFYPQFVPQGADLLTTTLLLGLLQVVVDAAWYLTLAGLVGRARAFFTRPAVRRRLERVTGAVLVTLGVRIAADQA